MSVSPTLRECHRLRKHLRTLQEEIDRGPRVLKAQQARLAAAEQTHKDAYDTLKKQKLKLKESEGTLKQIEQTLDKLQTRSMQVTTMKEMDATRTEIATASGKKSELEDAILATITDIDERTTDLPNVEARWAEAQKEFAQYQIDAKERLDRMQSDQKVCTVELTAAEGTLTAEAKPVYDRQVKAHGPDGLAAVVGRACNHCHSSMTEQQKNELTRGRFLTCPSCYRILYLAE